MIKVLMVGFWLWCISTDAEADLTEIEMPLESFDSPSPKVYFKRIVMYKDDRYLPERPPYIRIKGEVINETSYPIPWVRVTFFLKNSQGDILEAGYYPAHGENIEGIIPGKTGFFDAAYSLVPLDSIATITALLWFQKGVESIPGDIDNDGVVDFDDFFILADNFGRKAAPIE